MISHLEQKEKRVEYYCKTKKKSTFQVTEMGLTCNILLKYDFGILQKVFANNENFLSSSNGTSV